MKIKMLIITFCLLIFSAAQISAQEYVVKFNDSVQMLGIQQSFADKFTTATEEETELYLEAGIVEYYEPVVYAELLDDNRWQLGNIKAEFPQKVGAWGDGVKVGVIDSGINAVYGMSDRILEGYDFHYKTTDVTDTYGHGTFVSSMVVQSGAGVATASYIVPLKVFYEVADEHYTARSDEIMQAIIAAVDVYDCDVINLSLTLGTDSRNLTHIKDAIDYAVRKGAIVVAAVGNFGAEEENIATACYYPAAYPNVIGVGSVDKNKQYSSFSQRNDSVYVVAQGEDVKYRVDEQNAMIGSGTSFAAPQVSALAAVAKCINSDITSDDFMTLLKETSTDLGQSGYDTRYGYGLIDCEKAVKKLIEGRKVFISPVKITSGIALAVMYNNTSSPLNLMAIYACEGESVKMSPITLAEGQAVNPWSNYTSGEVRFMAWDGLEKIVPLGPMSSRN